LLGGASAIGTVAGAQLCGVLSVPPTQTERRKTGCGRMRDRAGKTYPFDKLRAGPQGLKPDVFSIIYGPNKVVP
jgi:hypothetical protein